MALVKVYDAEGVEFEKEYIDARECVDSGLFTYDPIDPVKVREKIKESFKEEIIAEQKAAEKVASIEAIKAEALEEVKSAGRPKKTLA